MSPSIIGRCVAVVALAATFAGSSCSGDDGAIVFTTSTLSPTSSTSSIPDPDDPLGLARPKTVDEFQANLAAAKASGDLCQMMAVIDLQRPDVAPGPAVVDAYRSLADAIEAATAFTPAIVLDDWNVIAMAARSAVAVAERVNGDVNDPSVQSVFESPEFADAYAGLLKWSQANCPS